MSARAWSTSAPTRRGALDLHLRRHRFLPHRGRRDVGPEGPRRERGGQGEEGVRVPLPLDASWHLPVRGAMALERGDRPDHSAHGCGRLTRQPRADNYPAVVSNPAVPLMRVPLMRCGPTERRSAISSRPPYPRADVPTIEMARPTRASTTVIASKGLLDTDGQPRRQRRHPQGRQPEQRPDDQQDRTPDPRQLGDFGAAAPKQQRGGCAGHSPGPEVPR